MSCVQLSEGGFPPWHLIPVVWRCLSPVRTRLVEYLHLIYSPMAPAGGAGAL